MKRYPRSIRYTLSTYSNNPKKRRNTSESQRMNNQDNIASNSFTQKESPNLSPEFINDYQQIINVNNKVDKSEDYKDKTEARHLIEQTKKMMEEYSLNKLKQNNKSNNKSMSNFGFDPNLKDNFHENNNKTQILSKDRLDPLAGTPNSIDSLTQKLICRNKEIKALEKELREKNNQLKSAQDKIAAKNEEIKKLLEILDNERSNSLKVENSKLSKKIYNLEKNNTDIKKNCDKSVEDLKIKINNLNREISSYQNRNKELENKNLILRNDNEKLRKMLEDKTNLSLVLKEKNEIEKKSNEMNNAEIDNLKMNLSNIIVLIKTLFNKETQIYEKRSNFLNKLNNLNIE
jgi:chromosome segregation ATPase